MSRSIGFQAHYATAKCHVAASLAPTPSESLQVALKPYGFAHLYAPASFPTTHFLSFLSSAPDAVRGRSPVLFYAGGVHFNYNITRTKLNYVQPIAELNRLFGPRLVPVWHGNHAPGDNIAAHYYRTQGRESVKKYNQDVEDLLRQFGSEAPATEGAFRMLHFYNATEGGESAIPFFLLSLEAASADTRFIRSSQPNLSTDRCVSVSSKMLKETALAACRDLCY